MKIKQNQASYVEEVRLVPGRPVRKPLQSSYVKCLGMQGIMRQQPAEFNNFGTPGCAEGKRVEGLL